MGDMLTKRSRDDEPPAEAPLLLVGLGNPGPRYAQTRHNVGALALERIAESAAFTPWSFHPTCAAHIAEGRLGAARVVGARPTVFMNLSGRCLAALAARYKPAGVLLLHDDLDLTLGRVKVKQGGGGGGHRGVASCTAALDGESLWRMRIGIGRPATKTAVADYVLEDLTPDEMSALNLERISRHAPLLFGAPSGAPALTAGSASAYMNALARPDVKLHERAPRSVADGGTDAVDDPRAPPLVGRSGSANKRSKSSDSAADGVSFQTIALEEAGDHKKGNAPHDKSKQ